MEKTEKTILEEIQGTVQEIISQIKELIRKGDAKRVIVKNRKGNVLLESRLTLGVAGAAVLAIYAPIFTAITTLVLYVSDVRVFVEKEINESSDEYEIDAEVIDIQDDEDEKKNDDPTDKTVGKKP
ncbi:DUF4342 domain-containing protein [Rhodohalobacter barkolensis]|uniref:DUF4342 domain-containing protein n=1 Tax=Rhodohalobacter barkolensis TaxID=2053187 RepID=A0A2N0VG12_9BACT|nr:DUF4342 domain-containing protein [Rhodohalobacter barkolensis]PKD43127.1 hypothetical protein CWD77_10900 [Rhodohalobacter barkolensis]